MKKNINWIFSLILFVYLFLINFVYWEILCPNPDSGYDPAKCIPRIRWDRTVEWNCDFPANYHVYWNITVWDFTINIPWSSKMWIDLASYKITFWNWKINIPTDSTLWWTWPLWWFCFAVWYWQWWVTSCPAWTKVLNADRSWFANYYSVATDWTMYCAKE